MSEELYVTGPVIVNGVADTDGDVLNNVEIRTIFAKYTNHLSDIQHDSIDYDGVDVLANWISENDVEIAGKTVPAKSWLATVKVTDPETVEAINNGELTCFSLGSVSNKAKTREGWFINKRISYHDLKSIEDVIPLRISLVDEGANGYPFEVTDYVTYIHKRSDKMTDEPKKFSLSDIKEIFGLKKEIQDEVIINKADEVAPVETAPEVESDPEKTIDALFEKIDLLLTELADIKEALATDEIEKSEDDKTETAEEKEKEIDKAEEEDEEKPKEEEEEEAEKIEKETAETVITKSTVKPHDIPINDEPSSNFANRTNRDALFRKIKN